MKTKTIYSKLKNEFSPILNMLQLKNFKQNFSLKSNFSCRHLCSSLLALADGRLGKAGYEDFVEGQYYKELFSGVKVKNNKDSLTDDMDKELKNVTNLITAHFDTVIKMTEDERFNNSDTIYLREHFNELLLRYKETIEKFADSNSTRMIERKRNDYIR